MRRDDATLQRLLLRAVDHAGTGVRLANRAGRASLLTWAGIAERAAEVAGALHGLGVRRGDRVALLYPTGAGFFDALFGVLLAGAVPTPLYPPVRLGRLEEYQERTGRLLAGAEVALVLADRRLAPLAGPAIASARPPLGLKTLEQLPAGGKLVSEGEPDELALVQFSSGTTVEPRPVALTHRAVLAQVLALNAHWPDSAEVRHSGVSWLPLYHDMGLIGCVFPALERPSVITLLPPEAFVARPALWLQALSETRATISPAPNFAYALAAERIRDEELEGVDLANWRVALCGAETVVAAALERFAARFAPYGFRAEALTPVYGLSEAALAVTFPPLGRGVVARRWSREALAARGEAVPDAEGGAIVSVGPPLAGFRIEIRDRKGRALPERRVGRIFVAGPSLFREYLGQPTATARVLADGWLDTGDLGFLDGGELYLTGRAKEVLIVRGRTHAPTEIEQAVDRLPGVRSGCVAATGHRPDGASTERVVLFVERRKGSSPDADEELASRCREAALAASGLALDEVVVLEAGALPRTSSGKIRRGETLSRHLVGTLAAAERPGFLGLALAMFRGRRALVRVAPPRRPGSGEGP